MNIDPVAAVSAVVAVLAEASGAETDDLLGGYLLERGAPEVHQNMLGWTP